MKRLKKTSNNHELQMFSEELSRIRVDVLANCKNLEAVIGWLENIDVEQSKKQHMLKELKNAHKQFDAMCSISFKDEDNTVKHVLKDIQQITYENKHKTVNKDFLEF